MADIFVQSFTHLKGKHNADKALHTLKRIASLVKPIMRKHKWILPVLAEFFPDNPNLLGLNINMGEKILIRLRHADSPDTFLPEESLVGTMLHELTHNVHGPHDDKFYKYLSGLQDEYDALQASGYAGEGFFSEGKRLGTNVSHNVPPHVARLKALEAAEKRKQTARVLGRGGCVGGRNRNAGLSPRELAARAAERRAGDEKSCASGPVAQREAEKAAKESTENKVIDLTLDDQEDPMQDFNSDPDVIIVEDVHREPPRPRAIAGPPSVPQRTFNSVGSSSSGVNESHINRDINPSSKITTQKTNSRPQAELVEWSCEACTLLNPYTALRCEVCHMRRPLDEREGWTCHTCGEAGISHDFWTCRWCGTVKLQS